MKVDRIERLGLINAVLNTYSTDQHLKINQTQQGEDARAAMLLYRARREEWEKELRKKHVHK